MSNRREFLKFLAASPLLGALPAGVPAFAQTDFVISNPADALNVFEFEAAARKAMPPAHWGYLASGVDNDESLQANLQGFSHYQRLDTRTCANCHMGDNGGSPPKPMFDGSNMTGVGLTSPSLTWDFVKRVKDATTMKVVLKGIETREDAQLSVEHGVDGIIVSNHGGRAHSSARATIDCLPEVVQGVSGRIPVIVDGGFRRGTDIFKAVDQGGSAGPVRSKTSARLR